MLNYVLTQPPCAQELVNNHLNKLNSRCEVIKVRCIQHLGLAFLSAFDI